MWLTKKQGKLDLACSFVFCLPRLEYKFIESRRRSFSTLRLTWKCFTRKSRSVQIHPHCNAEKTHDDPCSGSIPAVRATLPVNSAAILLPCIPLSIVLSPFHTFPLYESALNPVGTFVSQQWHTWCLYFMEYHECGIHPCFHSVAGSEL